MTDIKKVAIITAASKGMGAACAKELASKGYEVSLLARSSNIHELASGMGGIGITGSVANPSDLESLVSATMEKFGRIDAVVNNTGHPAKGDLSELTDAQWHEGLELVVLNAIRMSKLVVPVMQKQGGGSIVNISTYAAFEPSLDFPISSVLRAGLGSFTKLFSNRYAAENIRMNSILPGYTDSYEITEEIRNQIPMGRAASVDEIAKTASFLLSEDAGYITGQNIVVDGGITRSV